MGHYRRVKGKLEYTETSFQEGSTAMNSVKPSDLKPGDKVAMSGKTHTYLGSTDHGEETHHFQDSKGNYNSYPTNSVPPMQSRDAMEQTS
jgi:predicted extracellular nuclease